MAYWRSCGQIVAWIVIVGALIEVVHWACRAKSVGPINDICASYTAAESQFDEASTAANPERLRLRQ